MHEPNAPINRGALWCACACALACVFWLPPLLLWDAQTTHSALLFALLALAAWLGAKLLSERDRRLRRFSLAFGFVFALCQLAGARLDAAGTVGGGLAPLRLVAAAAALSPALGWCFAALCRGCERCSRGAGTNARSGDGRRVFRLTLAVILLCWLPVYLAYFPGMFNYDSTGEAAQFTTGSYNGAFPPVHTLLLAAFYFMGEAVGSVNAGIALYTAVQAAALAASMAYSVWYLWKLGCPRAAYIAAAVIFALLPFHPMMAMCTTKDLFFSAALLTLLLRLHMGWQKPELWKSKAQLCWVAGMIAAVCVFRPNGAAAIALLALAGLWMLRGQKKRFLCAVACGLAVFAAVNGGLNLLLKPAKTGMRELLSVPLMQTARVYALAKEAGEALEEEEEILRFIPDADRYQPHLADGVKRHTTVGMVNLHEYLHLWARVGAKNPAAYADAFLYLTKGYWHLDDVSHAEIYAERDAHGYLETANQDGFGVYRASLLPGLMDFLDRQYVDNEYQQTPILATLAEPALWCWLLWALQWLALYRRDRAMLFCSVMLLGLYATMLLGACAYMRYAYPLALCAVPLAGMSLTGNGVE